MCGSRGEQNTVSKFEPPSWSAEKFPEYIARTYEISNRMGTHPDEYVYQGARVAPLVQEQIDAIGGLRNQALFDPNRAQRDASMNWMLGGGAQHGGVGTNVFGGNSNPAFEQMLQSQTDAMTDAFRRGAAANTDSMAALSGAFGGSAHQEQQAINAAELAKQVGAMQSGARADQYNRAAQLYESQLGREFGARESDLGRIQSALGLFPQSQAGDIGMWQALLGAGEMSRSLDQQQLGANRDWFNEMAQMPLIGADYFGSALTRGSGGAGTTTSQIMGGNMSPWQMLAGGGLLGGGLYNMLRMP